MRRAILVVLALGMLLVPIVAASSPPRPICPVCGDALEQGTDGGDHSIVVQQSTANVSMHTNGSATWHIRNQLNQSASSDNITSNQTRVRSIVRSTLDDRYYDGGYRDVSTQVRNGVIHVSFRRIDASERLGDILFWQGIRTDWENPYLGVHRLVVHAPDGWTVSNHPRGTRVGSDRVIWPPADGEWYERTFDERSVVAATPPNLTAPKIQTKLAMSQQALPSAVRTFATISVSAIPLTIALLVLLDRLLSRFGRAGNGESSWNSRATVVAAVIAISVGMLPSANPFNPIAVVLGTTTLGLVGMYCYIVRDREQTSATRKLWISVGSAVVGALVGMVLVTSDWPEVTFNVFRFTGYLFVLLPIILLFPLGAVLASHEVPSRKLAYMGLYTLSVGIGIAATHAPRFETSWSTPIVVFVYVGFLSLAAISLVTLGSTVHYRSR